MSITSDMEYYNGLLFKGYVPGVPSAVLSGGRYDSLLAKLGKSGGAIGFALYLNLLERLLEPSGPEYDADVLLLTCLLYTSTASADTTGVPSPTRPARASTPSPCGWRI